MQGAQFGQEKKKVPTIFQIDRQLQNFTVGVYLGYGIAVIAFVVLFVWLGVITGVYLPSDDDDEDVFVNVTEINRGIVSKVRLGADAVVSSTDNIPFDTVIQDTDNLYDNTSKVWIADRGGQWLLSVCISIDQSSTTGFPTTLTYDHQIQVFKNAALALDSGLFLFVETFPAVSPAPAAVQRMICGDNVYKLHEGENITVKLQTRFYPATIVDTSIEGGTFLSTRGTLTFIGGL